MAQSGNLVTLLPLYDQELNKSVRRYEENESRKTYWLIPFFHLLTCRLCTWGYNLSDMNMDEWSCWRKYLCFCIVGLLSLLGGFLQLLIFLIYLLDILVYRPVLFIFILTNKLNLTDDNTHFDSASSRLYHEYENYFIFAWDYIYGLIGLLSTFFLFYYSWIKRGDTKTVSKLFNDIIRNKVSIYKYKQRVYGLRDDSFSFRKFVLSWDRRSLFFNKFGWSLVHLLVIVLSVLLVVYWIIVNVYVWMSNKSSYQPFTQDSDLLFILMIFDCIYWHLAPVLVCFLIRASCTELTTKLHKLVYKFAWTCLPFTNATNSIFLPQEMVTFNRPQETPRNLSPLSANADEINNVLIDNANGFVNENLEANQAGRAGAQSFELWVEYYSVLRKVSRLADKFNWISAVNSIGLIFVVVGLSVMYITKSHTTVNDFFQGDILDAIRLITWYFLNLISVWLMINSMSTPGLYQLILSWQNQLIF